jgi:predicted RNase H-like HicB family nuclease
MMPTISAQVSYPIELHEGFELPNGKTVDILIEVHEDGVIARIETMPEIFAAGATVAEARTNLLKAIEDELAFLSKHENELSDALKERLFRLRKVMGE